MHIRCGQTQGSGEVTSMNYSCKSTRSYLKEQNTKSEKSRILERIICIVVFITTFTTCCFRLATVRFDCAMQLGASSSLIAWIYLDAVHEFACCLCIRCASQLQLCNQTMRQANFLTDCLQSGSGAVYRHCSLFASSLAQSRSRGASGQIAGYCTLSSSSSCAFSFHRYGASSFHRYPPCACRF